MVKKRGRPTKPMGERVNSDGIFVRQWTRIKREAKARNMEPHQFLRWLLDDWFGLQDAMQENYIPTKEEDERFEKLLESNK